MSIFSLFFFLLGLTSISHGLKSIELCRNREIQCHGSYVMNYKYKEKCNIVECSGDYPFNCTSEICTVDANACQQFMKIQNLVGAMVRLPKDTSHLQKFYNNIKSCPIQDYKFEPKDACLTGKSCFYIETSAKISKFHVNYYSREIVCPCRGYHNYHCGEKFCTTNNLACNVIKQEMYNSTDFKKCLNDNQIIKKKI